MVRPSGRVFLSAGITATSSSATNWAVINGAVNLAQATTTFTVNPGVLSGALPAQDLEITGAISGNVVCLTKGGVGTLLLSGVSTYTGATTISAGTLKLGALASLAPEFPRSPGQCGHRHRHPDARHLRGRPVHRLAGDGQRRRSLLPSGS